MTKITSIEGVGKTSSLQLLQAGITSVENLLLLGASSKGRKDIAKATGLSEKQVLDWVNRADLFRIKGIGAQYADLLEYGGVDSVLELGQRNPEQLLVKLQEVNDARRLVRSMPYLKQVAKWVARAQDLPKVVSH